MANNKNVKVVLTEQAPYGILKSKNQMDAGDLGETITLDQRPFVDGFYEAVYLVNLNADFDVTEVKNTYPVVDPGHITFAKGLTGIFVIASGTSFFSEQAGNGNLSTFEITPFTTNKNSTFLVKNSLINDDEVVIETYVSGTLSNTAYDVEDATVIRIRTYISNS